jgi:hypothetical protein
MAQIKMYDSLQKIEDFEQSKGVNNKNIFDMTSLTITIPSGDKDSKTFKDALKVSIAASTYNIAVQWVKGSSMKIEY